MIECTEYSRFYGYMPKSPVDTSSRRSDPSSRLCLGTPMEAVVRLIEHCDGTAVLYIISIGI